MDGGKKRDLKFNIGNWGMHFCVHVNKKVYVAVYFVLK